MFYLLIKIKQIAIKIPGHENEKEAIVLLQLVQLFIFISVTFIHLINILAYYAWSSHSYVLGINH